MQVATLCVLVLCTFNCCLAGQYQGYKLYEVTVNRPSQVDVLINLEERDGENYDVWSFAKKPGGRVTIMVSPHANTEFLTRLHREGMHYRLAKHSIEDLINNEERIQNHRRVRRAENPFHEYYMRHSQIQTYLQEKARAFPSYVQLENIGRTLEDRLITILKISTDATKPIIWIDAGIHGREWIAPATAIYMVDELLKNTTESRKLLSNYQIYILPLVNPDGYEYAHTTSRLWRKNRSRPANSGCRGVDLNRNFPYKWGGKGASPHPCGTTFRGPYPGSEKETQAIMRTLKQIKENLVFYLTLHSYGQYILIPFGHTKGVYPPNYIKLQRMGNQVASLLWSRFSNFYFVGSSSDLLYEAPGGSDDYAAGELNIPFTNVIELPDRGQYGFLLPPSHIKIVGRQTWEAVLEYATLLEIENRPSIEVHQ